MASSAPGNSERATSSISFSSKSVLTGPGSTMETLRGFGELRGGSAGSPQSYSIPPEVSQDIELQQLHGQALAKPLHGKFGGGVDVVKDDP